MPRIIWGARVWRVGQVGQVGQVGRSTGLTRQTRPACASEASGYAAPKRSRMTSPRYLKMLVSAGTTNSRFAMRPSAPSGGA